MRYPRRARATDGALPGGGHVPECAQSTNIVFLSLRPCLSAAGCAWQRFRQMRIACWLQLPTDSGTDDDRREAYDMADMHNAALSTQMHSSVPAASAMQRCLLHDRSVLTAYDGRISAAATTPAHCIGRQTRVPRHEPSSGHTACLNICWCHHRILADVARLTSSRHRPDIAKSANAARFTIRGVSPGVADGLQRWQLTADGDRCEYTTIARCWLV